MDFSWDTLAVPPRARAKAKPRQGKIAAANSRAATLNIPRASLAVKAKVVAKTGHSFSGRSGSKLDFKNAPGINATLKAKPPAKNPPGVFAAVKMPANNTPGSSSIAMPPAKKPPGVSAKFKAKPAKSTPGLSTTAKKPDEKTPGNGSHAVHWDNMPAKKPAGILTTKRKRVRFHPVPDKRPGGEEPLRDENLK